MQESREEEIESQAAVARMWVSDEVESLGSYVPLPGLGIVPVNAFLIHSTQPILVDTGVIFLREAFLSALHEAIDPAEIRWLWLTHADPDHIGSLMEVLAEAPNARLVTTYLAMGKLSLYGIDVAQRAYLVNPGQELHVGDRTLVAFKPPTFDAPESTGFQDTKTGAMFSVDTFGALMSEPAARAADISPAELQQGLVLWTTVDSPWMEYVDRERFGRSLETLRRMDPSIILSSHLPPAMGMTETLLAHLRAVPEAAPFVGPDQAALERSMAAASGR